MKFLAMLAMLFVCLCVAGHAAAPPTSPTARDLPPGLQIPDAAKPGPNFNVDGATEAYLDLLSPAQRAQSDAYFEGGYWLQLWDLLYGLAVALLLLRGGISTRMRNLARSLSPRPWLYTWL